MLRPRPVASSWVALALAAAVGCDPPGGTDPQPATCVQVAGTWDVAIDLDPQAPGTSLCHQVWTVAQAGCTVSVAADLPCPVCFIGSPLCWGASGEAPAVSGSYLSLGWSWASICSYVAELQARSDGATLDGSISLTEQWAPGGTCPGVFRFYGVTGTRR